MGWRDATKDPWGEDADAAADAAAVAAREKEEDARMRNSPVLSISNSIDDIIEHPFSWWFCWRVCCRCYWQEPVH